MKQKFFAQDVSLALSKDLGSIGLKYSPLPDGHNSDFNDTSVRLAGIRSTEQG